MQKLKRGLDIATLGVIGAKSVLNKQRIIDQLVRKPYVEGFEITAIITL